MGYWCTIHLFDERKFYKEIVPQLKSEAGDLTAICLEFLKSYVAGGTDHLSPQDIIGLTKQHLDRIVSISNSFDATFKIHSKFNEIKSYDNQRLFLNELHGYYDFCKFFEFILFKTCADFFPHVALGKGGVARNFTIPVKTVAYAPIEEIDYWNSFLSADMTGITNWISSEDVELLYLDKENLHATDYSCEAGFLNLLEAAQKNGLGLIVGVDMREEMLELLPAHKLTSAETWLNKSTEGLLWKR